MAQFDTLIISTLLFSLSLVLSIYYLYSIKVILPFFSETKKFRNKKISVSGFTSSYFLSNLSDFRYS